MEGIKKVSAYRPERREIGPEGKVVKVRGEVKLRALNVFIYFENES